MPENVVDTFLRERKAYEKLKTSVQGFGVVVGRSALQSDPVRAPGKQKSSASPPAQRGELSQQRGSRES